MNLTTYDEARLLPLASDTDIESRVTDLVGRANCRQLWLMFLDGDDVQLPILIPVDGLPTSPTANEATEVVTRVSELMTDIGAASLITVWERYGPVTLTAQDAVWARLLRAACDDGGVKLRGMLLSHRTGVRWIAETDYRVDA